MNKGRTTEELIEFFKVEFDCDIEEDLYEMTVPNDATDEQIIKLLELIDLRFYKLCEIKIN